MRLIDKDKLKTAICIACSNGVIEIEGCVSDDCTLQRLIDDQPTIEPEVRHGRWIPIDGEPYAKCSYCGEKHYGCTTPYCDMCGARMDFRTPTEAALDMADSVMMGGADNDN